MTSDDRRLERSGSGSERPTTGWIRLGRGAPIGLCGALAFGLVGCSDSGSSKSTTTTPGLPSVTTSASAPRRAGGVSSSGPITSFLPGQIATAVPTSTSTTAAGRVVSSPSDYAQIGDTGRGVEQIQAALVRRGYEVRTDGQFGPQTSRAVKAFQKANGLTQDGIVGPVTWAKLRASGSPTSTTTQTGTTTRVKSTTTTSH
jgi:peptidoglycan hydrolase-like protein with peptidoglycan-binding domain